jgi:putative acetyltransferase
MKTTSVPIRPFRVADAAALAALFHASVRQAGLRDYTPEQVSAWSPAAPDPGGYIRRSMEDRVFLVAVDAADEPMAYGDLEPDGHIDHLYCRPDRIGIGIGSALYDALENAAVDCGMQRLFVEASEAARRLFERKGFVVEQRNDFSINGVAIHNYQMAKPLCGLSRCRSL